MRGCSRKRRRRAKHLSISQHDSKNAISTQDAEQMMGDIVREIQKNFHYDHIGIGIMDFATKDIEIKAGGRYDISGAGQTDSGGDRHFGRVARTGASALFSCKNAGQGIFRECCRNRAPSFGLPINLRRKLCSGCSTSRAARKSRYDITTNSSPPQNNGVFADLARDSAYDRHSFSCSRLRASTLYAMLTMSGLDQDTALSFLGSQR